MISILDMPQPVFVVQILVYPDYEQTVSVIIIIEG